MDIFNRMDRTALFPTFYRAMFVVKGLWNIYKKGQLNLPGDIFDGWAWSQYVVWDSKKYPKIPR
jgi:hypothetical protein